MKKKIVDPAFRAAQRQNNLIAWAYPSKVKDTRNRANVDREMAALDLRRRNAEVAAEQAKRAAAARAPRERAAEREAAKKKPLKEHYKTRLSHRLDEGRFTRALGNAARQTGRAIQAVGGAAHAGGVTATEYTGKGMSRLGKYMAAKPRQAFNRGLAATAAAGLVYGGYQLGKNFSGPQSTGNRPAMKGVPSGRGGVGVPDDTISPVRPGHSRKGSEVAEP